MTYCFLLIIYFINRKRRFSSQHYSVYLRTDEIFHLSRSEKKSRSLSLNAFLARFRSLLLSLPGLVHVPPFYQILLNSLE